VSSNKTNAIREQQQHRTNVTLINERVIFHPRWVALNLLPIRTNLRDGALFPPRSPGSSLSTIIFSRLRISAGSSFVYSRVDPCGQPGPPRSTWPAAPLIASDQYPYVGANGSTWPACPALSTYWNSIVLISPARIPTCRGSLASPFQKNCSCSSSNKFVTKALLASTTDRILASTA
jgi:hypothetical protein